MALLGPRRGSPCGPRAARGKPAQRCRRRREPAPGRRSR
jgi:hypothetical protein